MTLKYNGNLKGIGHLHREKTKLNSVEHRTLDGLRNQSEKNEKTKLSQTNE